MALTYSIDPDSRLVTLTGDQIPDFGEWQATMLIVLADPAFRPGFDFLTDRRRGEEAPTVEYLRRAVSFLDLNRGRLERCRWAVVVRGPAAYGMGRMAEAFSVDTSVEMRVFTEISDAQEWLGLRPAEVRG